MTSILKHAARGAGYPSSWRSPSSSSGPRCRPSRTSPIPPRLPRARSDDHDPAVRGDLDHDGTGRQRVRPAGRIALAHRGPRQLPLRDEPAHRCAEAGHQQHRVPERAAIRRGPVAGPNRTDDFESMAYDEANDWLFVFSGPCCDASHLPTVFRLVRVGGIFQVESYQPLAATANHTASAWSPADQKLYVGQGSSIRTYDYVTNTTGTAFRLPVSAGSWVSPSPRSGTRVAAICSWSRTPNGSAAWTGRRRPSFPAGRSI